jgi:DNA polymerase III gamma/tau subunit
MNKTQISELLEYWYKRQNNPRVPVPFRFKGYKMRGTGEIAKVDRKGKGKVNNTKGPPKKGKTGKVTKQVEEQESSSSDSNADTDSDSDNDTDSETDSPKTKLKADRSGRKEEPRSAAEARMKKLQAARERALQQAKKKFLKEMKGSDDGGDDVGTSAPRGKKRTLDAGSDGDHSDVDGARQKGKKKDAKLESPPRKMTTRSRGAVDATGLSGPRRSERGSK